MHSVAASAQLGKAGGGLLAHQSPPAISQREAGPRSHSHLQVAPIALPTFTQGHHKVYIIEGNEKAYKMSS